MAVNEPNQLYSLCLHKETGEHHVFLTHKNDEGRCFFSSQKSICGDMDTSDKKSCNVNCVPDTGIRKAAANIGDTVCGNCMQMIYKTPEE